MRHGQESRDPGTHGVTHDVRARDAQMFEQSPGVFRHRRRRIGFGVVELFACAMAAIVDRDDAPPVPGQRLHPTGGDPVDSDVGRETMDQQDRVSASFIYERDFHAI